MTVIDVAEGDITTFRADAIGNAANSTLLGGGGVDGAIHRRGGSAILAECRTLGRHTLPDGLAEGAAVDTTAGNLAASWVIHTVGPRFSRHEETGRACCAPCYTRSLAVADGLGARTVAFPLISAGAFGWPTEDAVKQAVAAIRAARTAVDVVTLVGSSRTSRT
ncbi:O-acetyl-ADP-ribose deacetylase [Rhodococcus hoagii]|nr:O-acetyl-ADP-ribose deacetylase [Prescottella equi]